MSKLNKVICLESVHGLGETVNRDKGTAYGVKVIQMGQVNDARPFKVDEITLQQIVDLGNRPNRGIKVRMTHPQGDGIGSHLGRASNFYIDGDSVRADLTIAKSAQFSPMGNMFEYFFSMAEEDPEALGMSIAAVLDGGEMEPDDDGFASLRVSKLWAVDVVGDPAATRGGLFHYEEESMSEEIKPELEENLSVEEVVDVKEDDVQQEQEPEAVVEPEKVVEPEPIAVQQGTGEPVPPVETKELSSEHNAYVEAFGDVGARWYLEGRDLVDCYKETCELQVQKISELQGELAELNARVEAIGKSFGEEAPAQQSVELSEEEKQAAIKAEKLALMRSQGWSDALAGMSSVLNG
jgi:hypothetical protein